MSETQHCPEDGATLTGQIRLWWLSWDGPAYPSGTQVAEAVTASDWFADAINSAIETGRQEVYATLGAVTAERDRLQAWKDEASPVLMGLQDIGKALGLPLGASITGPEAAAAATAMREELQRLRDGLNP